VAQIMSARAKAWDNASGSKVGNFMLRMNVLLCALLLLPGAALAQKSNSNSSAAFNLPIPNIPGKSIEALVVDYPPGGGTPAHRHAKSAFITGYVLSGAIRSQVDSGPAKVYHQGEYFTETPGAHHRISENASKTEPAKLLAIFVLDTGEVPLTTLDE
jgi:quercetin dioxygenase-like cupin family protein